MGFDAKAIRFLQQLEKHNEKAWFDAHKNEYEAHIREPALRVIEDVAIWFEQEGLPYKAEPKKMGGSLSRIYRDVRFSDDKTPYHTHVILHFGHRDGTKDRPMPSFGVRFDAQSAGIGGGIWTAPTPVLNRIRDAIVADPDGWHAATEGLRFDAERLKTAPRGYDKDHPMIEALRMKGYLGHVDLDVQDLNGDFAATLQAKAKPVLRYCDWLADVLA